MLKTSREKVVKNAEKYVSRGKIASAIKEYLKVLDEDPDDISTLNRVGDLYARIDRNSEAIELFSQIAERYADDGFLVKAIAIYKKIIKLDPTLLEIYEQLADLYHRQGLVNEARTQYQVLADYYVKHDKPASAISVYERMVELEPDNPSHHAKLADLYQKEDLIDEAMGEFRAIAELMLEHNRVEEAAQVYERGLAVSAEDIGFITDAVLKLKELGNVSAAARLLTFAVERNPRAESVARIAGLGERPEAPADTTAEAEPPDEAETEAVTTEPLADAETRAPSEEQAPKVEGGPDDGPSGSEESTAAVREPKTSFELATEDAAAEPGTGGEEPPGPAAPREEVPEEEGLGDFELEGFELDEDSSSLVQPPADMLDRDRPGAAWSRDEDEADTRPGEKADASAPPAPPGAEAGAPDRPTRPDEPDEVTSSAFEFELDLDADGDELLELAPDGEAEEAAAAPGAEAGTDLDHDLLERTAAEVEPEPESGPDDLFTEAEVLAKYGIEEKALERLADLLQRRPRHLEGYALMVGLHLDARRHQRAASVATRMAEVAAEVQDGQIWEEVQERLEEAGYRIEGRRVSPPPGAEEETPPSGPEPTADLAAAPATEAGAELEVDFEADSEEAPEPAPDLPSEPEVIHLEPGDLPEDLPADEQPEPPEAASPGGGIEVELDEDRFELPEVPPPEIAAGDEPEETAREPEPDGDEEPSSRPRRPGRVETALAELSAEFTGGRRAPRKEPSVAPDEAAATDERAAAPEAPSAPAEPPPAEPAGPAPSVDPLRALGDSLREEIGPSEGAPPAAAASAGDGAEAGAAEAEPSDAGAGQSPDTGTSWLDEVPESTAGEDLFAGEEDFFDLGAELEQELTAEGGLRENEELLISGGEQSLEDIVEGFKRGVAENLSTEDYDTHFNLGIAYREMGLLDEAIGEFQLAAKHADYLVSCASMLGLCFLEKGHADLAVKWYRRGLEAPELSEEDQLGLLYDLGNAQASGGDSEAAYRTFVDLYGINTNYRDVVARLAELEPRQQGS
ncbi:MAG: hypothetical protein PVG07_05175 [Acidobacteriota bacterium]|jgi:tetratricopeptide (TPR) repeat protein